VPSLLELRQVVEAGDKPIWGNLSSLYHLIGGESFAASTLRSAGFEYTHVESGWEAMECRQTVDVCLEQHWLNAKTWQVLEPSLLSDWVTSRYGNTSVPGTFRSATHLSSLESHFDDGRSDFIFAHFLLPHSPVVVDDMCEITARPDQGSGRLDPLDQETTDEPASLRGQLPCVDTLVETVSGLVGAGTAAIITGDHGPGTLGQARMASDEWSDAAIAERLGVLLAYRVPAAARGRTRPRTSR
jgi:hypothetical protein